jgi:hypothetical protein
MIEALRKAPHSSLALSPQFDRLFADGLVAFPFIGQGGIVAILNLAFASKALRSLCEDKSIAERKLGVASAGRLIRRLADLRAADSLADILAGGLVQYLWPETSELSFGLNGSRLVLRVNHHVVPVDDLGDIDWKRVTRVKIVRIEDNHEYS